LEEIVVAPVYKIYNTAVGTRCADYTTTPHPQKLALTSLTSGGRSVGIAHSLTQATGFSCPMPLPNTSVAAQASTASPLTKSMQQKSFREDDRSSASQLIYPHSRAQHVIMYVTIVRSLPGQPEFNVRPYTRFLYVTRLTAICEPIV
jgi:hypothetical protein